MGHIWTGRFVRAKPVESGWVRGKFKLLWVLKSWTVLVHNHSTLPVTLRHLVKSTLLVAGALLCLPSCSRHDDRLRIFIQTGKTSARATEQNYAAFLTDWKSLLSERGAEVEGAARFPNKTQLAKTDVLVIYSDREAHSAAEMSELNAFLKRGGGLVLIHDAIRGLDPDWLKLTVGGALDKAPAVSRSGVMGLYFQGARHPIVEGVSNFDIDDKLPPTSTLNPDATVLATTFQSTNEIVPQIWAYENKEHRAVVCLPGENQSTFLLPHFRALILRSIAWQAKGGWTCSRATWSWRISNILGEGRRRLKRRSRS
jgi:type 1 glutamine amidotransferase